MWEAQTWKKLISQKRLEKQLKMYHHKNHQGMLNQQSQIYSGKPMGSRESKGNSQGINQKELKNREVSWSRATAVQFAHRSNKGFTIQ